MLQVHATDNDDSFSAAIDYSLYKSNNSIISELFGITHDTGEIYLRKTAVKHGEHY